MKKLLSMFMLVLIVVSLVACGGSSDNQVADDSGEEAQVSDEVASEELSDGEEAVSDEELPILGAGIYSAADSFLAYIGNAIENESEGKFSVTIEDGQYDQARQNNQVDSMLARGASVVTLGLVDKTAAPTIIEKCKAAGDIPVIFFNNEVTDTDVIDSYDHLYQVISTGGDYGSVIQGEMVADYINSHPETDKNGDGKIQIVLLSGEPGHSASQPRAEFVKSTIEEQGIELDVLEEDTGMWRSDISKDKMDAWISKHGDDIEFIIAGSDAMALGALQSIQVAGYNMDGPGGENFIPVIGIDALPEVIDRIENGEMIGSVLQDASGQGKAVVQIAQNFVEGNDPLAGLEEFSVIEEIRAVEIPYQPVTAENAAVVKEAYE